MNRYKDTEKVRKNGQVYYRSTYFANIPTSADDIYVITQYGDRLDLLAYQYYGNASLWWYIARANNMFTLNIPENIQLRIPSSIEYAQGT